MKNIVFDGKTDIGNLRKLPDAPGVYFFLGRDGGILYIGKATSLRDRARSYFASDIRETRGPKIAKMLGLAASVGWRETASVLEALVLEARLIKERQPSYNTDQKDDKSYNHVVITDEPFPRVLVVRGRDLSEGKFTAPIRFLYGPFPHGGELREAVRIVRRIFPFRDRCIPRNREQGTRGKEIESPKPCFHRQIGLCPGVCTGEVSPAEYRRTVKKIELFFEGKRAEVVKRLEREMHAAAEKLEFEKAGDIKRTLHALGHIRDVSLLKGEASDGGGEADVRIEAYDVAHLSGQSTVGVMTVLHGERADRDSYRKFLLRGDHAGDDLSSLGEILRRRLRHDEWPRPDIAVLDGGFLQRGVALRLFREAGWGAVRLVGVVKNRKHQPERLEGDAAAIAEYRRAILLANAEAHRFAIGYHRKRRGKEFLGE